MQLMEKLFLQGIQRSNEATIIGHSKGLAHDMGRIRRFTFGLMDQKGSKSAER